MPWKFENQCHNRTEFSSSCDFGNAYFLTVTWNRISLQSSFSSLRYSFSSSNLRRKCWKILKNVAWWRQKLMNSRRIAPVAIKYKTVHTMLKQLIKIYMTTEFSVHEELKMNKNHWIFGILLLGQFCGFFNDHFLRKKTHILVENRFILCSNKFDLQYFQRMKHVIMIIVAIDNPTEQNRTTSGKYERKNTANNYELEINFPKPFTLFIGLRQKCKRFILCTWIHSEYNKSDFELTLISILLMW